MNIQISVSVWTIICFVLMMLILHNLLFKPVLELMDKRKERVKNARDKKEELERMAKEQEEEMLEKQIAARNEQQKKIESKIESVRTDSKKKIEEAREARLREFDEYHVRTDKEHEEILRELNVHVRELAALFAESLIKE